MPNSKRYKTIKDAYNKIKKGKDAYSKIKIMLTLTLSDDAYSKIQIDA